MTQERETKLIQLLYRFLALPHTNNIDAEVDQLRRDVVKELEGPIGPLLKRMNDLEAEVAQLREETKLRRRV